MTATVFATAALAFCPWIMAFGGQAVCFCGSSSFILPARLLRNSDRARAAIADGGEVCD